MRTSTNSSASSRGTLPFIPYGSHYSNVGVFFGNYDGDDDEVCEDYDPEEDLGMMYPDEDSRDDD